MDNIEQRRVKKGTRTEIISAIALQMWSHTMYPQPEEYNGVCQMLIDKYPVLKDSIGNGYVSIRNYLHDSSFRKILHIQRSWKTQLRQKFSNLRRNDEKGNNRGKRPADTSTDQDIEVCMFMPL